MHEDKGAVTTRTAGRTALLAAATGLLAVVLLGSAALPALADPATVTTTADTAGHQVAERGSGPSSSDVIVAGLAALGMLATAVAVLWHTARTRGTHLR